MSDRPSRREVLWRLGQAGLVVAGSAAAAALGMVSPGRWAGGAKVARIPAWRVPPDSRFPPAVVARGGDPAARVRAAVERVGGMSRFVRPGETVLVKPNIAWDRTPEQAANTLPEIVGEVVKLCREARAGKVIVADVPVHDAARTASRSGIRAAALEAGALFQLPGEAGFATAALNGALLARWEVLAPALAADRLINLPVVKEHPLSRLTCGMKNLYGLLGGTRGRLHQNIHLSIADLAAAFLPTLTVVDATRVMMRGGPQGGRLEDLMPVEAVAAGTDPVALDAWGATLLGARPEEIDHIVLAQGRGLGTFGSPLEEIHAGT